MQTFVARTARLKATRRIRSRPSLLVIAALITGSAFSVNAHHSPAAFDMSKESVVEGVISEVSWRNPHVYLTVETVGADGRKRHQEIEAAAASSLLAYGVQPGELKAGERVSIRVNPSRRGDDHEVLGVAMTRANGEVLALRAGPIPNVATQAQATSLNGMWSPDPAVFAALALGSQRWPLTEAAREIASDPVARAMTSANCEPFGIPAVMAMPDITSISITDRSVVFDIDSAGVQREVHLVTEFPRELAASMTGYSIGHWEEGTLEEGTLVVETKAFAQDPEGLGFELPSSEQKHVVERFTLSADKRSLVYEATLTDPVYLTEVVNIKTSWAYRPDLKPSGESCDMESARRFQAAP